MAGQDNRKVYDLNTFVTAEDLNDLVKRRPTCDPATEDLNSLANDWLIQDAELSNASDAIKQRVAALEAHVAAISTLIVGGGLSWQTISGGSNVVTLQPGNGYKATSNNEVIFALPPTAPFGATIKIIGQGMWRITQGAGQQQIFFNDRTTVGQQGYVETLSYGAIATLFSLDSNTWEIDSNYLLNLA